MTRMFTRSSLTRTTSQPMASSSCHLLFATFTLVPLDPCPSLRRCTVSVRLVPPQSPFSLSSMPLPFRCRYCLLSREESRTFCLIVFRVYAIPILTSVHQYDPNTSLKFSEEVSQISGSGAAASLDQFRTGFKPLHKETEKVMYFS